MPAVRSALIAVFSLIMISGCIVPVPKDENPLKLRFMSRERLKEYTEQVFRRHNQVMSRLMMATLESETLKNESLDRLERAESRMSEACSSLNLIAEARAGDGDPGLALKNRVRRSIRECDEATAKVEKLLDELSIAKR